MAHKQLLFNAAAREKVLRGAAALADAIRVTLGPRSKSVLIERRWGKPLICNDGVTIAREIDLKDPEENLGAQVLEEAAGVPRRRSRAAAPNCAGRSRRPPATMTVRSSRSGSPSWRVGWR